MPQGWICGCTQEVASGPLKACLALLWESEGVSTRRGSRSVPADNIGSYGLDLVSRRRYEDYPGEGIVGPNMCIDWERWRSKCRPMITEHGLVVCLVDATAGGVSLIGQSESGADGSSGYKKAVKGVPFRGFVQ